MTQNTKRKRVIKHKHKTSKCKVIKWTRTSYSIEQKKKSSIMQKTTEEIEQQLILDLIKAWWDGG